MDADRVAAMERYRSIALTMARNGVLDPAGAWAAAYADHVGDLLDAHKKVVAERDEAREVIVNAASRFLDASERLPKAPRHDGDVLLMSAAWLDFIDHTIGLLAGLAGRPDLFTEPPEERGELQAELRRMAASFPEDPA